MFALVAARCTSSTWLAHLPGLKLAWKAHKVSKAFKVKSDLQVPKDSKVCKVMWDQLVLKASKAFRVLRVNKVCKALLALKVCKATLVL